MPKGYDKEREIYVLLSRDTHDRVKTIAASHGISAKDTYAMIATAFQTPAEKPGPIRKARG